MEPRFFRSPAAWRAWLAANHAKAREIVVGYWKRDTGKPSLTWPESVDEALCYGWIDGVRKSLGDESYQIRFTPRKPTSHWSRVNVERVAALRKEGRMRAAGEAAFAARDPARTARASYERNAPPELAPAESRAFRARAKAWAFFSDLPPSTRRACTNWIVSAKRPETRAQRLATLIACSAKGELIPPLRYGGRTR